MDSTGPDYRHRLLYTALFVLAFRILALIPVLNVDKERLNELLAENPLLGALDLFAGGKVLDDFSLVAAGLLPYLAATLLVSAVAWAIPHLRKLEKAGEKGKKRIELYRKLMSVPLALLFGWALSRYLTRQTGFFPGQIHWYERQTFWSSFCIIALTTLGAAATAWITHGITKKGIGDGAKVILLVGSIITFFTQILTALYEASNRAMLFERLVLIVIFAIIVATGSFYLARKERRIPVRNPRIQPTTSRPLSEKSQFIPFSVNRGSALPLSAAVGLLALLQYLGSYPSLHRALGGISSPANIIFWAALAFLLIFFVALYNFAALWKPFEDSDVSVAESLRRQSLYIPNVRPGKATEKYLTKVVASLTAQGALGLALLGVAIPYLVFRLTEWNALVTLISVIVFVKTFEGLRREAKSYRLMESYDGLLKRRSHPR